MEAFLGSWKLVSSLNFDEYMAALGLPPGMRHYGNNMTTVLTFSREGDDIVMKTKMIDAINRSVTITFRLDEEFEENSVDFRLCKTVFKLEEGKLVQVQKWDGNEGTAVRQVQDGKLITTFIFRDIVCVRTYEKV